MNKGSQMKIAYVTAYDATDVNTFQRLKAGYYMARALQQASAIVHYIGPLERRHSLMVRAKTQFYGGLLRKVYTPERDRGLLQDCARQISHKLAHLDVDVVLSPISLGSQPIAYLDCPQPIVIWTDATFAGTIATYPEFKNLCGETLKDGRANERSALARCNLAIYWSEWAAKTAIDTYALDPAKVKVVPVGPNLECDRDFSTIQALVDARPTDRCRLLFLGAEWYRKGGDVALAVASALNASGLDTELTIVGCEPTLSQPLPGFARCLGFVSKSSAAGTALIESLLAESHFLIMPSRAEAFGAVFVEASSFGTPSLATNVNGIPSAVRDGVNGQTFPVGANAKEYCSYVTELFSSYSRYRDLALSSFNEYQSRLNWRVAAETVTGLMKELLN